MYLVLPVATGYGYLGHSPCLPAYSDEYAHLGDTGYGYTVIAAPTGFVGGSIGFKGAVYE